MWSGEDEPVVPLDEPAARRRLRTALADLPQDLPAERRKRELVAMGQVMPGLRGRIAGGAGPRLAEGGTGVSGTTGNDDFKGYRSPTRELLEREQAPVWSQVTLHTSRGDFSGLILPRSETADALHIVLKLDTGYNIGVRRDTVRTIAVHGRKEAHYQIPEKAFPFDPAEAARQAASAPAAPSPAAWTTAPAR